MKKIALLLVCVILVSSASATITIFDANDLITSSDTYDTVVIKGSGTVVDMTGGSITKLIVMDSARINISSGTASSIFAYDSGVIHASGGSLSGQWKIYQNASVQISGTANVGGVFLCQNSSLILNSDSASITSLETHDASSATLIAGACSFIKASNGSSVSIDGGYHNEIYADFDMPASMEGSLHVSNGVVESIVLTGCGTSNLFKVRLSGGTIQTLNFDHGGCDYGGIISVTVEVVGYDLFALPYSEGGGQGAISGYWNDGTPFNINIGGFGDSSAAIYAITKLFDGILPEDCDLPPESDTNNDCVVNMMDLQIMASEWLDCGREPQSACP